jgi:hypothetical protein
MSKPRSIKPAAAAADQETAIEAGGCPDVRAPAFWRESDDPRYLLGVDHWANSQGMLLSIPLTSEEYHALKTHLARMRGFNVEPEEKAA